MQARPVQTVTSREGIITTLVPHTSRHPCILQPPRGNHEPLPLPLSSLLYAVSIVSPRPFHPVPRIEGGEKEFNNVDLDRGQGVSLPDLNLNCY